MIEVLKQMIEALEWCHGGEPVGTAEAIQAGKQLIAELESQEPVAWMDGDGNLFPFVWNVGVQQGSKYLDETLTPLYTHPPQRTELKVCCQQYDTCLEPCTPRGEHLAQRTWVGLTDKETSGFTQHEMSVVKYVSKVLQEKNT